MVKKEGLEKVNNQSFLRVGGYKTKGYRFKVKGGGEFFFKKDLTGSFFTQRVARIWKELPEEVVETDTIATFERHLKIHG